MFCKPYHSSVGFLNFFKKTFLQLTLSVLFTFFKTMGGDFSGKNQDCSKGVYALAGNLVWLDTLLISCCFLGIQCAIMQPPCLVFSTGCISNAEETELQEAGPSSIRDLLRDLQWKGK